MKFDFRTEWTSWVMVVLMIIITAVVNHWPLQWSAGSTLLYVLNLILYPLIAISMATIPVLIWCWARKIVPDLDYSIRLAFVYMLFVLAMHFLG